MQRYSDPMFSEMLDLLCAFDAHQVTNKELIALMRSIFERNGFPITEADRYLDSLPLEPDHEWDGFNSDAEADADVLRNAGWGTDEDYGFYGDSEADY